MELASLAHAGLYGVGAAWAFGGNAAFAEPYLLAWGAVGAALTASAGLLASERALRSRVLARLWPFLAFNFLTLIALTVPGFRALTLDHELMLLPRYVPFWQPSSATPHLAFRSLGLFDGLYLSAFNVLLLVRRRRALRALLLLLAGNAVVLAVFGTIQKLGGATGLYFGAIASPQSFFFASFVYDNHWGAYIILMTAALLGLVWHHALHGEARRDWLHSPALTAAVGVLVLALSVPLSGARICTALLFTLLAADYGAWLRRLRRQPDSKLRSAVTGAVIVLLLVGAGSWYLGGDFYRARIEKTREQLAHLRTDGGLDFRLRLYRDTWRMAQARPGFGWGSGSYPHVFQIYNTAEPNPLDHLPRFFHDAHSDWLQSLAEHGWVGSAALVLCALVPAAFTGRRVLNNRLSRRLLAGCAVVLAYALIEFPFGNFAVQLTWWLFFFGALRYGALSEPRPAGDPSPEPPSSA